MSLHPEITILKILLFATLAVALVIWLYASLSSVAMTSGSIKKVDEVELTDKGNRKSSW
jgi:hypothetical protein